MRAILFVFFTLILNQSFAQPLAQPTDRILELERRLNALETQQADFTTQYFEGSGRVQPFFGDKLRLGGFFETAITHLDGPDTEMQISAHSQTLGINIAAELGDKFKFVTQILTGLTYRLQNLHNNPLLTPSKREYSGVFFGSLIAQAYAEYFYSPLLIYQAGLGYVPFGYAFQQREPVLLKRRGGPLMVSGSGTYNNGIAFPLWMGLHVRGDWAAGDGRAGYNVYTFSPATNQKTLGLGTRIWHESSENTLLGISTQSSKERDHDFFTYAFDISARSEPTGFVAEYARSMTFGKNSAIESYYIEPFINFAEGKWLAFLTADYINNGSFISANGTTELPDPYKKWAYGGGVNWLPLAFIRTRLSYLYHQYSGDFSEINNQKRHYHTVDFSVGVTF